MYRTFKSAALAVIAAQALLAGQGKDASQVLTEARVALGGDKLQAVKTLSATGRSLRTGPGGSTVENEFELALALPDKYRLRTALMAMGIMSVYRHTGFNGGQLIEEIDRPPNLSGANVVIRFAGPGGSVDPEKMTPAQKADADRQRLLMAHQEFARLALGLFAASPAAYPLEFTYIGQAAAPDGTADVLEVKGEGGFTGRLFIDAASHLPLMLTWQGREPLVLSVGPGGTRVAAGGALAFQGGDAAGGMRPRDGAGQPPRLSPQELDRLQKDLDAKRAEAEANRRMVEFRVYYGDYRSIGGVKLPFRIQRAIDGRTTEEMVFDTLKVNAKIDPRTFEPSK